MSKFLHYLDPTFSLEARLRQAFNDLGISDVFMGYICAFLNPLSIKDRETYEHSIRVGLLARRIGKFIHMDEKALFYAGVLHDVGKAQTDLHTLQKTSGWTEADTKEIQRHVMDGYRLIRQVFDFSAEILLWHHRFQWAGYPKRLPPHLHKFSLGTEAMIALYGRILAIADCYDALHRVNDKHGDKPLTGEEIKRKMFEYNPDQRTLLLELYEAEILTTTIVRDTEIKTELEPERELAPA